MQALTQTGIIENPNLSPEDETRATGCHAVEGVAYLLRKDMTDLETIETLPGVGAFHKSRDDAGFYLVNVKDMSCSCPGYKFRRSCRHITHVEARIKEEAFPKKPATSKPHKMTENELAVRKARIDARNRKRAEERAATKITHRPRAAFRPNCPDEIEVTA